MKFETPFVCPTFGVQYNLRTFDGWSAAANRYLDMAGEKVNILEVATVYRTKVSDFYRWFRSRQEDIHAEEIRRLKDKENELHSLHLQTMIDAILSSRGQGLPFRAEDAFLSILGSQELDELGQSSLDASQKAARAIELIEKRLPISQEIKQRIIRLYQEIDVPFSPTPDG